MGTHGAGLAAPGLPTSGMGLLLCALSPLRWLCSELTEASWWKGKCLPGPVLLVSGRCQLYPLPSVIQKPGWRSQLCHKHAVWPWGGHFQPQLPRSQSETSQLSLRLVWMDRHLK